MMSDNTLAVFMDRIDEIAAHTPSGLDWKTCWAILASGERRQGTAWARRILRAWRQWSWAASLEADERTCRWCAARMHLGDPRMRYCDDACRKQHWRARKKGEPSPLEHLVSTANERLAIFREEAADARVWFDRIKSRGAHGIVPPDLLTFPDLPLPPDRCGGGCERPSGCGWTEGGPCLFSRTRSAPTTTPPNPRPAGPPPRTTADRPLNGTHARPV